MDIVLDDDTQRIYGNETIRYHNNSKDDLEYLWVQLDQNMRAADSKTPDIQPTRIPKKAKQEERMKIVIFLQLPLMAVLKLKASPT